MTRQMNNGIPVHTISTTPRYNPQFIAEHSQGQIDDELTEVLMQVGSQIDALLRKMYFGEKIVLRSISTEDRTGDLDELLTTIQEQGTDRTEPDQATSWYEDVDCDIFAVERKVNYLNFYGFASRLRHLEARLRVEDRPPMQNIILVYDSDQMESVPNIRPGTDIDKKDAFRFKGDRSNALRTIIVLEPTGEEVESQRDLWRRYVKDNFYGIDLTQSDFYGEDLSRVDFSGKDLTRADFREAILEGTNFSNAVMEGTRFGCEMALTERLGAVIEWYKDGDFSSERYKEGMRRLFESIRLQGKLFTGRSSRRFLDIGCGDEGTKFVNRFAQEFPGTQVVYLDRGHLLKRREDRTVYDTGLPIHIHLQKPNKVSADAAQMPFQDDCFGLAHIDIVYGGIDRERNRWNTASPYDYTKEARRILKPGGKLVFSYKSPYPKEEVRAALTNLREIGFSDIEHLSRLVRFPDAYNDLYVTTKR